MKLSKIVLPVFLLLLLGMKLEAQTKVTEEKVLGTMMKATEFMVDKVSTNGGYVWYYMPDFSRQWGEMEAYKTMIWMQGSGTIGMGSLFLDAYRTTKNEYYYEAAQKVYAAVVWGQSNEGGWNYMVDFAGDRSLKQWYNTIGKNGWRLEEFHHYYGNSTFDDDVTADATHFLLRMYLEKMDPSYKPALDKAIDFILKSQYPNGGWPQRYPYKHDYEKHGFPDYTSFYTFNDDVIWENINLLIQCYLVLGEERFLDPIYRGMDFYKISQDNSGAWGQQLNMKIETASARTYEPAAFHPPTTCENALLLIKFYQLTGDKEFLEGVPKAISWLEIIRLPEDKIEGKRTHPRFVATETNKPIYVHRKGSNATFGLYYVDDDDHNLVAHYYGKVGIELEKLKDEYKKISEITVADASKTSPLRPKQFQYKESPQKYYTLNKGSYPAKLDTAEIEEVINALDNENRWLTTRAYISNPYIGDGIKTEPTLEYNSTRVADETDTSPYLNTTNQKYIVTGLYIRNMRTLINYIQNN